MKIVKSITISLSPDDLREIICKALKDEGYNVNKDDIDFNVKEECTGYGPMERYRPVFNGCTIDTKLT